MNMLCFVHIPKTAGTSFRTAAAEHFGKECIYADYGPRSAETSRDIYDNMYRVADLYNVKVLAEEKGIRLLTGHVHSGKYNHIVESSNMVTFLRHPVAQVVSHYEHFQMHHNYDKKLEDFIVEERFTNIQSRALGALPLELYGFIGVTERYNESIDLFNAFYGVDFKKLSLNTKSSKGELKPKFNSLKELDKEIYDVIARQNAIDMQVYQRVLEIFDERYSMYQRGHDYVMGFVGFTGESLVSGVACKKDSRKAVELEVYVNGDCVGECKATEPRPHLRGLNVSRGGYVGFTHSFAKALAEGDEVKVLVKETGQVLQHRRHIE